MGRPRKHPIMSEAGSGVEPPKYNPPPTKEFSKNPNDKDWMVYDLAGKWADAIVKTGTIPSRVAVEELVDRAKYLIERILNG